MRNLKIILEKESTNERIPIKYFDNYLGQKKSEQITWQMHQGCN